MNKDIQIFNCHTHLFTLDHIPRGYYGLLLYLISRLLKYKWLRAIIISVLTIIKPVLVVIMSFLGRLDPSRTISRYVEKLPRLAAFLRICESKSQVETFKNSLRHYYPKNTRFVVLPMDYTFMGYGAPKRSIDDQLTGLAELRDKFPDQIIPFVHIDPRHSDVERRVKEWIINFRFKGVKIYPPFGYLPTEKSLTPIYNFCEHHENGIPVMTHCAGAILRAKEFKNDRNRASSFCAPRNYIKVLEDHPKLRLCLGHFGGDSAWDAFLKKPLVSDRLSGRKENDPGIESWLDDILEMLRSGKYPNLYVDISYVIFHFRENSIILKVLLEDDRIRPRVLFGTDYYMVEVENFSERQLSMFLRATIGEQYYKEIAEINPKRYLFGT